MMVDFMSRKKTTLFVAIVALLTVLPFIGLNEFHTKGEPREAVVSLSMLLQDNWILPVNNGGDIPYKPPFFHWCIAVVSMILGGVSEFTSRIPSSLSLVAMIAATFAFYAKYTDKKLAMLTAMISLSSFELHRAGMNCRVDMMLTMAMVCSQYLLFRWWKDGMKQLPWLALITMSCATLTKGPIGVCLPCAVFAVFLLIRGVKFWTIVWKLALVAIISMIAPSLWYVAAYNQGGDSFWALVYEENVGRLTGTMTYASHEGPAIINFVYLISGFLPWTFVLLVSLFFLPWKSYSFAKGLGVKGWLKKKYDEMVSMSDARLYTLLCAVLIVLFFCIPKSKRSVYLMPSFPFIAYFMAEYIKYLAEEFPKCCRIFKNVMIGLIITVFVIHLSLVFGIVPESVYPKKDLDYAMFAALAGYSKITLFVVIIIVAALAFYFSRKKLLTAMVALSIMFFALLDAVYLPTVLNTKSVKRFAADIEKVVPTGNIYSFLPVDLTPDGNPLHFFELDYYLNDRIHLFVKEKPAEGYLIVLKKDFQQYFDKNSESKLVDNYIFDEVLHTDRNYGSFKDIICLMHFEVVK